MRRLGHPGAGQRSARDRGRHGRPAGRGPRLERIRGPLAGPHRLQAGARSAVLTSRLSREWNRRVGDVITLSEVPFRVIGVVESSGGGDDAGLASVNAVRLGDRAVFIPLNAPLAVDASITERMVALDAVFVRVPVEQSLERVMAVAQRLLSEPGMRLEGLSWITARPSAAGHSPGSAGRASCGREHRVSVSCSRRHDADEPDAGQRARPDS